MFITKKNFEKAIQEEVSKRERELNNKRAIDDEFRYLREDMNDRFKYVSNDIRDLERKISKIEKELHPELENKCCCKNENEKVQCTAY